MKRIIVVFLVLLLTPFLLGMNLNRITTFEVDGEVDLGSVSGNNLVRTGVIVKGEGYMKADLTSRITAIDLSQVYTFYLKAKEGSADPIYAVSGIVIGPIKDKQIYVAMIKPQTVGELNQLFNYSADSLSIVNEAGLFGSYQHFINLESNTTALEERFKAFGLIYIKDLLSFTKGQ